MAKKTTTRLGALTGLESYGKLIGAVLVLNKLEEWRNESPEQNNPVYQRIALQILDELDFDRVVKTELPDDEFWQKPLGERVRAERRCCLNALVALYKGRQTVLPRNVRRLLLEERPTLSAPHPKRGRSATSSQPRRAAIGPNKK